MRAPQAIEAPRRGDTVASRLLHQAKLDIASNCGPPSETRTARLDFSGRVARNIEEFLFLKSIFIRDSSAITSFFFLKR